MNLIVVVCCQTPEFATPDAQIDVEQQIDDSRNALRKAEVCCIFGTGFVDYGIYMKFMGLQLVLVMSVMITVCLLLLLSFLNVLVYQEMQLLIEY